MTPRRALLLIACLSLVHLTLPFRHLMGGAEATNAFLTNDDTYYYLQTAWNLRKLGFVTFDGINPTNGVQLLWFAIVSGLSWIAVDKTTFLLLASTLAVIFTWFPYLVISVIARDGESDRALMAVVMASLWLAICMYPPNQYLVGMESAVHACVIWLIVFQYIRIRRESITGDIRPVSIIVFIMLLVFNAWARLDSIGLSASFFALLILTTKARANAGWAVNIAAVSAVVLGAVVLFGFFWVAGGSLLPVSALVKGSGIDRVSLGAFYNWSLVLFPLRIPGANLLNILGIIAFFASVAALVRSRRRAEARQWSSLRLAALGLAMSVVIHSVATFGMFRYYYFWYLSASFTYWTIVLAIFASEVAGRTEWNRFRVATLSTAAAGSVAVLIASADAPSDLATTRYRAARWIDTNLEHEAVLASFNAGQLGFWSHRSVVNLDGLVNNVGYFETVLRPQSPQALGAYLDRLGVDYVVDYQFGNWGEAIDSRFATLHEFRLASGGSLLILARKAFPR